MADRIGHWPLLSCNLVGSRQCPPCLELPLPSLFSWTRPESLLPLHSNRLEIFESACASVSVSINLPAVQVGTVLRGKAILRGANAGTVDNRFSHSTAWTRQAKSHFQRTPYCRTVLEGCVLPRVLNLIESWIVVWTLDHVFGECLPVPRLRGWKRWKTTAATPPSSGVLRAYNETIPPAVGLRNTEYSVGGPIFAPSLVSTDLHLLFANQDPVSYRQEGARLWIL